MENDNEKESRVPDKVKRAKKEIYSHRPFKYGVIDLFKSVCSCYCLRLKKKRIRSLRQAALKKEKRFQIGAEQLEKEMDVINLLKMMRILDILSNTILT